MDTSLPNIRILVPVGSEILLNPSKLPECGCELGILSSAGSSIINFDYSHPVAYSDNEVIGLVMSYETDSENDNILYMSIIPDEKEDTILFIRMPREFKGELTFLKLNSTQDLDI